MKLFIVCAVIFSSICGATVHVKGGCEAYPKDLWYNEVDYTWNQVCLHSDFILNLGESRLDDNCMFCKCEQDPTYMPCCSISAGDSNLPDGCEVVTDADATCGYRVDCV